MNLGDPLEFIDTPELGIVFGLALAATIVAGRFIVAVGPPASAEKPIKLELPLTKDRAKRLIDSWTKLGVVPAVRRWVWADFPFILAYVVALAAIGSLAGRATGAGLDSPDAEAVGAAITYAGFAAGALDAVEDIGMLAMLGGHLCQPLPVLTTIAAALKWALVTLAVIASLGLLIASAIAELI